MTMQSGRAIGIIGTLGRACLGCIFLYLAYLYGVSWLDVVLGFVVFPAVLLLWQQWRSSQTTEPLNATGPVGFAINFAIAIILFSIPLTSIATLLFYGVSLWLAAIRGYAGCEVLAISNWLLRRDDQVGCVVFSPIDAVETRLTKGA